MRFQYRRAAIVGGLCATALLAPIAAKADNGGLSFWLPGTFGSLAAAPTMPGWAYSTIYLHVDQTTGASATFQKGGSVVVGLGATADALVQGISYTFATPILGGQASVAVLAAPGNIGVGIDGTLTGPRGNSISGFTSDNRTTVSDVFYQGSLKWNQGVNNEMVYVSGNIPSGTYDPNRLANLSFGFTAVDFGAGYTYLDPKSGHEFSVVGGLTYSGMNEALQYQNGIDFHLDWAASQFVSKTVLVGVAGYYFQQITADSGAGAKLGSFEGRVPGYRSANRVHPAPLKGLPRLLERESLQGLRSAKPPRGIHGLGYVLGVERGAGSGRAEKGDVYKMTGYCRLDDQVV